MDKKQYRYILQPYKGKSTRYKCPSCGVNRSKTLVRYIDTYTGRQVADDVGKCDRVDNCGYHNTPAQYFEENGIIPDDTLPPKVEVIEKPLPVSYIPNDVFKQSLKASDENNFIKYLNTLFDTDIVSHLIARYFLGSTMRKPGGTIFWQLDTSGNIRTGKIMYYNPQTGKRIKGENAINWIHTIRNDQFQEVFPNYNLQQCFFGEHLLKFDKEKTVAIVESEKTAIIANIYLPQFIWIANGSRNGLNEDKCAVLRDRKVILFPDINAYDYWKKKANEIARFAKVQVSDLLERNATDEQRKEGLDIADFLVQTSITEFQDQYARAREEKLTNVNIPTHEDNLNHTPINITGLVNPICEGDSQAYVGMNGKLYIKQPDCLHRYAVYDSIEAYNKRLHLPSFENELFIMQDFMTGVMIDIKTLTAEILLNP